MSDTDLVLSRMNFIGALVASVTFGAYAVLASICIHYLVKRGKGKPRQDVFLIYTVVMLVCATIWFVVDSYWTSLDFVGPARVDPELFRGGDPRLAVLKNTLLGINIWLADSMITYRLYIIWGSSIAVVVIPCLLWLGTFGSGIALLVLTTRPNANFFEKHIIQSQTTFFCLSISLNVLCTVLIAGMLWYRQWDTKRSGTLRSSAPSYKCVIAIIIESAALYSVCGLIYIPTVIKQLPLQSVVLNLIGTVTCMAPNLIILRLALGVAISPTRTKVSSLALSRT